MKLLFLAIGKSHETYVKAGTDDFSKRIQNYFPVAWKILPPAKQTINTSEAAVKKQEAAAILGFLQKDDYLVVLDEHGKEMSSEKLAQFVQQRANESVKQVVFLIGGAFGLDETVLQRARFTWSLSALTFPHQLVRLILAEQVYRACTILRNEKYHHP
jgi:23S rRNA (pseudouridine1915-N3)-methyltransferase